MERDPCAVNSIHSRAETDACAGVVKWDPLRSIWNGAFMLAALVFAPLTFTWEAFGVFLVTSAITLCAGHSVGFHRRLIHRSFECPLWLEYAMVWCGVAVGMGGPLWMIRTHDTRDWAQRQPHCHDYYAHRRGIIEDGWWNLHCRVELANPPHFDPGPRIADDRFYRFLESTWMAQQVLICAGLYLAGGWPWVVWGGFVRVSVSVTMHWFIGYFAHRSGPQTWTVDGAGVQAHDIPIAALPTIGESWHNNHHAFPGSARHGLYPGQWDPGWWFICALERLGLAWSINTPENLPTRHGLTAAVTANHPRDSARHESPS